MPLVPINITGPTFESRSRPLSAQVTQNLYAERVESDAAKSSYVLHAFPGMRFFGAATGKGRGMFEHRNALYKVTGTKLYRVSTSGNHAELGDIPGTARCIFAGLGEDVVVVTQGVPYLYNGSTVAAITDADLETPNSVAHLNNQIIYDGDGGRFVSSDVGDATSIGGLNYATAEASPDDILRVYVFDQRLYLMGEKTIETWWNSGSGSPPFDRIEGGIMQVGLAALHSAANTDRFLYFLGDDSHVYQVRGTDHRPVTDTATYHQIAQLGAVTGAIGFCFELEGQGFYCLTLPGEDRTFLFSEQTGWSTLSSDGGRTFANSYAYVYRRHLIEDYRGGSIYEWDVGTYDDAGVPQIRIRTTGPLHGGLLGAPGRKVEMNSFELIMETGMGLLAGQGQTPKVALQFSDDGGRTWSTEMWENVGQLGEYLTVVRWRALGSFYERVIRVKMSDPVFWSIHSAAAEIEIGI